MLVQPLDPLGPVLPHTATLVNTLAAHVERLVGIMREVTRGAPR